MTSIEQRQALIVFASQDFGIASAIAERMRERTQVGLLELRRLAPAASSNIEWPIDPDAWLNEARIAPQDVPSTVDAAGTILLLVSTASLDVFAAFQETWNAGPDDSSRRRSDRIAIALLQSIALESTWLRYFRGRRFDLTNESTRDRDITAILEWTRGISGGDATEFNIAPFPGMESVGGVSPPNRVGSVNQPNPESIGGVNPPNDVSPSKTPPPRGDGLHSDVGPPQTTPQAVDEPDQSVSPSESDDTFQYFESAQDVMDRAEDLASRSIRNDVQGLNSDLIVIAMADAGEDSRRPVWSADFLRQALGRASGGYIRLREALLESFAIGPQRGGRRVGPPQPEVNALLGHARDHAQQTTGSEVIHLRHLLSALLTADPPAGIFVSAGIDLALLRQRLFDWMRDDRDDDDAWRRILFGATASPLQLAPLDADQPGSKDLLDIEGDVRAFATLIAASSTTPPLSIGLFGDWGSGKTFFMRQLRSAVAGLSSDARRLDVMQRDLPFYKRVVQIEFNAWHYVEGNLWASLVEHIFDHLHVSDDDSHDVVREMQEHWIRKLETQRDLRAQADQKADKARQDVADADEKVGKLQTEHDDKVRELKELSARNLARDFQLSGAQSEVNAFLESIGLRKVGNAAIELQGALREARAVLERGNQVMTPLLHAEDRSGRWRRLVIVLLAGPVVTVVVAFITIQLGKEGIAQVVALATGAAAFLQVGADWLRKQAQWMSDHLKRVEEVQKTYDVDLATAQAETGKELAAAEQELDLIRQKYAQAEREANEARKKEAEAATELEEATAGRLLGRFIEDRAASTDYRKHLGLLALVRDDFERLSALIEEENWRLAAARPEDANRTRVSKKFANIDDEKREAACRINRIVLYIDDLDRCPPAKVVDVLQAVHLLLAFPLFVVVVGVDARWIARSLETRYRELLHDGTGNAGSIASLAGVATTEDYLEKIFQIPFWLRPMDEDSTQRMLKGLIPPTAGADGGDSGAQVGSNGAQKANGSDAAAVPSVSGTTTPDGGAPAESAPAPDARATPGGPTPAAAAPGGPAASVALALETLRIGDLERKFMNYLAPLLERSPRALKRFVNSYRLIKASLSPAERGDFLRENARLPSYQCVLILLALDIGFTGLAPILFAYLQSARDLQEEDEATSNERPEFVLWTEVVKDFETIDALHKAEWARFRSWIENAADSGSLPTVPERLEYWSRIVSRFSFRTRATDALESAAPRVRGRKRPEDQREFFAGDKKVRGVGGPRRPWRQ